ncbi:MFS transporter [Roseomonas sp. KE2513]|uniref:MFS transporter n=1 Tax=Roseomonas sp. KE2513 TaxID=2479202 RepID=UPI0018DFDECE|nr:MFS transporter [Roseomonas sp. KE2513]MBI0536487.1 MFS transporter [Roseomonas sp. KE2513]
MSDATLGIGETTVSRRQTIYAVLASVLGWSLDLFDLFILLYVAPVVGALFFPSDYPTLSLAAVYGSFAVTLLMRPLGSALFGSYADSHGRKGAMVVAVTGVGLATAAFGLLPTVAQVGLLAPVMFLVLRLVQGIFVGGVVASTHTIGTESVPARYRGLMSGLVGGGGAAIGALLASVVFLITSAVFPDEAFAGWGWRVMFFSGIMSSLLGLFVFRSLEESPFYQRLAAEKAARPKAVASPLRMVFGSEYRNVLLLNLLITTGGGAGYYLTSGYLPSFLKLVNKVPNALASEVLIVASVGALIAALVVGWMSDVIGRKPTFIIVGLCELVLLPLCFLGLAAATSSSTIFAYGFALAFLGNAGYAPVLIFLNERFPTELRASGTGLSWNIGFAIGGMMPTFVSLTAGGPAGIPMALSAFAVVLFLLYLVGALVTPETRGRFE